MNFRSLDRRMRLIQVLTVTLFLVLIGRLFQIQWAQRERFDAQSRQQETSLRKRIKRGMILDREHRELAVSKNAYSLVVDPSYYRELVRRRRESVESVEAKKAALIGILARFTNRDREALQRIVNSPRRFEWVQRRLDYPVIGQIEAALKDAKAGWWPRSALRYEVEEQRSYPNGSLAAHVIGYTNVDGKGIDGLEREFDALLQSEQLTRDALKDGKGRAIDPETVATKNAATRGSLVSTIDEHIQFVLEKELAAQCKAYDAAAGVGIVMNPRTGEVLALANCPTFDLNQYNDPKVPAAARRNRAIWWPYEPGSVFKIVTLAALLDANRMRPDDVIDCEQGVYVPRPGIKPIRDSHPFGKMTLAEVIQKSSNIGTLKAAQRFTQEEFRSYIERFGLLGKTGIDLPFERQGTMAALSDTNGYAMFFAPWGQGISVTPIQMLSVVNAIANDGVLMRPRIVLEVLDGEGRVVKKTRPEVIGRVISSRAAREATEIMVGVVERGTGLPAKLDDVRVAGKTGTSQKADEKRGGYKRGVYISSFVGFFPAESPRYSMIIVVDEPKGAHYGGQVAAPVFKRVAEQILQYDRMRALTTASDRAAELLTVAASESSGDR